MIKIDERKGIVLMAVQVERTDLMDFDKLQPIAERRHGAATIMSLQDGNAGL
jgi:hypothetical protein